MNKIEFLAASLPSDLKINVIDDERKTTYITTLHASRFHSFAIFSYYQPIIRHIDTLTQECVQADYNDGKPFIPIVELAKMNDKWLQAVDIYCVEGKSVDFYRDGKSEMRYECKSFQKTSNMGALSIIFGYDDRLSRFYKYDETRHVTHAVAYQLQLFQQLLKWHFWPNKPEGEEGVYVSNEFNPYK